MLPCDNSIVVDLPPSSGIIQQFDLLMSLCAAAVGVCTQSAGKDDCDQQICTTSSGSNVRRHKCIR